MVTDRAYMPQAKSQEWETPRDLFDALWEEFGGFDLDPCCRPYQYTAQRVLQAGGTIRTPGGGYDKEGLYGPEDGLTGAWGGKVYMNPPYGREIVPWIEKAVREVENGNAELVVGLLPVRTDTRWWQNYILRRVPIEAGYYPHTAEVRFIKGRLRFGGAEQGATFPSAVVVWRR